MEAEREVQGLGCTERGHWPGVRGRQRLDRGTESEAAADPPPPRHQALAGSYVKWRQ